MKREDMELFDDDVEYTNGTIERKRKPKKKQRPTKDDLLDAYDEVEQFDKGRYSGDF